MKIYGVIMAGGGGTRFWPMSRKTNPKQLLNLYGNDYMINQTIDRISKIIPNENIFIVTNEQQIKPMLDILDGRCREKNILIEPTMRDTSACIGYAAMTIMKKYGDGIMCIFPADHVITDELEFSRVLNNAINKASQGENLITMGIKPSYPSTGYGYINFSEKIEDEIYKVLQFVEKPNREKAQEYMDSGKYLWNSGMFIWKVSTILNCFKQYLPDIYVKLKELSEYIGTDIEKEKINDIYPNIPKTSIDYGIMEKSDNVLVIPCDYGWNDVGTWDALDVTNKKDEHGNIVKGKVISLDTKDSIIYSNGRMISTIGVKDLVIIETQDAILVTTKKKAQEVKKVVEKIKELNMEQYL